MISASRGAAAPSRHRRASSPGEEAVRTVSSEYDAPRRSFNLNIIARQTLQAIGGCVYLVALDPPLATLSLCGMALAALLTDQYGRLSRKYARETSDRLAETASTADEALRNVRVARACGAENQLYGEYEHKIRRLERVQDKAGLVYGLSRVLLGGCKGLAAVATMALGFQRVSSGALDPDKMVRFAFYAAFVNGAAFDVGDQWARVEDALGAGAAAFDLARRVPEWAGAAPPSALDDAATVSRVSEGRVEFDSVRFAYPSRNATEVLRGVSIQVNPGERVALVGASGSGKSTLTKLLLRQYGAASGSVRLDGVDVRDIPQSDLARSVASVEQDPALFSGSIRDNVRATRRLESTFCGRVDGVEPRRHRADAVAGTPSRRWRQRECPYTPYAIDAPAPTRRRLRFGQRRPPRGRRARRKSLRRRRPRRGRVAPPTRTGDAGGRRGHFVEWRPAAARVDSKGLAAGPVGHRPRRAVLRTGRAVRGTRAAGAGPAGLFPADRGAPPRHHQGLRPHLRARARYCCGGRDPRGVGRARRRLRGHGRAPELRGLSVVVARLACSRPLSTLT
jgi:hypothetical protein